MASYLVFKFTFSIIVSALFIKLTCSQISPGAGSSTVTYTFTTTSSIAPPTNPCTTGTDDCMNEFATCIPIGTTDYRCECVAGYLGNGRGDNGCVDFNECTNTTTNLCQAPAKCVNEAGSFRCECSSGYVLNGRYTCQDINECLWNPTVCSPNSNCSNTPGSYGCNCLPGFVKLRNMCVDVNECSTSTTNQCILPATCQNTVGSFLCNCPGGYTSFGSFTCANVNECLNSTLNNCDINANCSDHNDGYKCFCKDGFIGDGITCRDVDECVSNPCDINAKCNNLIGGYSCKCKEGYIGNGEYCNDFNECLALADNRCKYPAVCLNNVGSYGCQCPSGYDLVGLYQCQDVNECAVGNICPVNSACENTLGSFNCICGAGYKKQENECVDVNECLLPTLNRCHKHASCINSIGSYACQCNSGYGGDGFQCINVDECLSSNNCSVDADCKDNDGGFKCTCKTGYRGDGFICTDNNECSSPSTNSCNQMCLNTPGSYQCSCQTGYILTAPHDCQDINECDDPNLNKCDKNALCENSQGSYKCTCKTGYTGDGKSCVVDNFVQYDTCNYITNQDRGQRTYRLQSVDGIPLGGQSFVDVYICVNGFMSLEENKCEDAPAGDLGTEMRSGGTYIAPFWSDVDTTYTSDFNDTMSNRVYFCHYGQQSNSVDALTAKNKAQGLIRRKSSLPAFEISEIIIATWYKVQPFGASNVNNKGQGATFQAFLATDYINTFIGFAYFDMNWKVPTPVQIGYRSPTSTFSVSKSSSPSPPYHNLQFDKAVGNTGEKGFWLFHVNTELVTIENQRCNAWSAKFLSPMILNTFLANRDEKTKGQMSCPCCIQQAIYDGRYEAEDDEVLKKIECVHRINPKKNCASLKNLPPFCIQRKAVWFSDLTDSSGNQYAFATRCCYEPVTGGLIKTVSTTEESLTQNYLMPTPKIGNRQKFREEAISSYRLPFSDCCLNSPKCDIFKRQTIIPDCSNFTPRKQSPAYGDPHIVTLDGYRFTFNGLGDYYLLKSSQVEIQSRTCKVVGPLRAATAFCGYAIKGKDDDPFEIYFLNGVAEFYVNRIKQNLTALENLTTSFNDTDVTYKLNDDLTKTIQLDFLSGVSVAITISSTFLQSVVSYPTDGSATSGLLGTRNGNPDDDLTTISGQVLPKDSSEEKIYYEFGQTWLVKNDASLFTLKHEGLDPSFTPFFFTTVETLFKNSSTTIDYAKPFCGDPTTNRECFYDFAVTLDVAFAKSGKEFLEINDEITQLIDMKSPIITGPLLLNITYNKTFSFVISAISPSNATLTYLLLNSTSGAKLINNKTGLVEYTPRETMEFIEFAVTDQHGLTAVFRPQIVHCNCRNGGICDYSQYEYEFKESSFSYLRLTQCDCLLGFDGPFCETEVDLCIDDPCFSGVSCTVENRVAKCNPCPAGYNGDGRKCYDIDDCALPGMNCEQICQNVIGGYYCECLTGYNLQTDNKTCADINECKNDPNLCSDALRTCVNTNGSYACQCSTGYREDSMGNCTDIDECQESSDNCQQNCVNSQGSFTCGCQSGFTLDANQHTCNDINECTTNSNSCHGNATCSNTIGSFACTCKQGFNGNGTDCRDINECDAIIQQQLDLPSCNYTCENTIGSYFCTCPPGFQLSLDKTSCIILNPCLTRRNGDCDVNAECSYSSGMQSCNCRQGFTGNGLNCQDINECEVSHGCEQGCNNTIGSFQCTCESGYVVDVDGYTCNDINECVSELDNCGENFRCLNTKGSFTCVCNKGYQLQGNACRDIDECKTVPSPCEQVCTNTNGSYVCTCFDGFELFGSTCENQDECSLSINDCHENATCTDTPGSYTCTCREGFSGDGKICQDVNECIDSNTHGCRLGTATSLNNCVNTVGGFYCKCPSGYALLNDGKTCVDNNECLLGTDTCQSNQKCINIDGSFQCRDLCPGNCNQRCNETLSGIKCYCQPGYQIIQERPNECQDINECNLVNDCHATAECVNSIGSYNCRCPSGYIGNGKTGCLPIPSKPNEIKTITVDLRLYDLKWNGAAVNTNDLRLADSSSKLYQNMTNALKEILINLFEEITSSTITVEVNLLRSGNLNFTVKFENDLDLNLNQLMKSLNRSLENNSYFLKNPVFAATVVPSSITLQDLDECATGAHNCNVHANCQNTELSYTCACKSEYEGDGFSCKKKDSNNILPIVLPIVLSGLLLLIVVFVWILAARRRRRMEQGSEASNSVDGGSHIWEPFPTNKMRARSMYLPKGVVSTHYRDVDVDD